MDPTRYITTYAVLTDEKKLIPVWDNQVKVEKGEYSHVIKLENNYRDQRLTECILDIKTKELSLGIELNYYPIEEENDFKKGEVIFFERKHRLLEEATIMDIVYEEYEVEVMKGRKLDKWYIDYFKDINIEKDSLYFLKKWQPFYILDNGIKVEREYQLYHKFK